MLTMEKELSDNVLHFQSLGYLNTAKIYEYQLKKIQVQIDAELNQSQALLNLAGFTNNNAVLLVKLQNLENTVNGNLYLI